MNQFSTSENQKTEPAGQKLGASTEERQGALHQLHGPVREGQVRRLAARPRPGQVSQDGAIAQ